AVASAKELAIIDASGQTIGHHAFERPSERGPDFDQVVAAAEGRARGWGEKNIPPDLHVLGGDILMVREVTDGTELRRIQKDASVAWERLLPPGTNNPLRLSFVDDRRIGLHGTYFEPATVVLDSSSGTEIARLNLHSEEALLANDALLAIGNSA